MAPALGGSDRRLQRSLPWGIKESSLRSAFWGTPRVVGRPVCGCWDRHYTLKVSNWIPVWVPALLWPRCGSLRVKGHPLPMTEDGLEELWFNVQGQIGPSLGPLSVVLRTFR